jgi:hypothetical protein
VKVTMADARACKMCARGARAFFRRHGLDWSQFIREGVESDVLVSTGDAMAPKVVEHAKRR